MNSAIAYESINIEDMIYVVNGIQIMFDADLAKLYHCKNGTKEINQAVKNNPKKFPSRFCFKVSDREYNSLKSIILTSKGGSRKGHNAFTEEGVAMLATIIHSEIAVEISIQIMDAFVKMRHFLIENSNLYRTISIIDDKIFEHDEKINYLFSLFEKKDQLLLKGQMFDSYESVLKLLENANNEIIIIDNYADISFLNLIKKIKVHVILVTKDSDRLSDIDIEKYNKQYNNLHVIRNNDFHDRYIVIDRNNIYHMGSSINNIGNKVTMLNRIDSKYEKDVLLAYINIIINKYDLI